MQDGSAPRGMLPLITALVAMGVASMALYVPSLPAIQADFGVEPADTQLTLTLFFLGFSTAQLLFGPLSDRFGRRPIILIGLVLYSAISLACAFAPGIEALQIGRFLQGFAACVGPVVGRAVVRDKFDGPKAITAFAVVGTALAIVPAVAPMLGGFLQAHIGWRANFVFLTLASLILLATTYLKLTESVPEKNLDALKPRRLVRIYGGLLSSPFFMGQALASSLAFAGFFAYFTEAPFLFIGEMGLSPDMFGLLMIFTVAGYASGSFLAGRLIPRLGTRPVILLSFVFLIAGSGLLYLLSDSLTIARVIGPMSVYTIGFGMVIPGSMAEALRPFPRVAGSASAILGFFQFFCAALTSLLVQPLYDGTARTLALVIIGVALFTVVQFLVLTRNGPPEARESAA
ncbi:multidrug effflux MFS transporter [Rhodospirillaceae bacterium KN72]|uniref:Bcr/CflA family efflux transporter n=1 Tax=Pacificispira spongiicola TaxID=2729598 RepID=A0A7Y0E0P2_9PROT|nr:multidrug effflux MFS transporter [Pacificispira spongiicola]NMM45092.1 multidrug effflux MFS transporter [Pacificispira spongiicola]